MKPLGWKKTRTHVHGHADCAVCHPDGKGGRAAAKRNDQRDMEPSAQTTGETSPTRGDRGDGGNE